MAEAYGPNSYATPLVYLYNGNGVPLNDRFGRPLFHEVIDFQYEYNSNEDDQCTIIFQTDDPYLADHPALQEDTLLKVRWGYVKPNGEKVLSDTRSIAVRDTETTYSSNGIKLKLKCTDQVAYLKEIRENGIRQDNFIDWLSEIVEDEYRVALEVSDRNVVTEGQKRPAKVNYKDKETGKSGKRHGTFDNIEIAVDETANPYMVFFTTKRVIKGQSRAITAAIEDELKFAKGGPYALDGRDDKLTIHNFDFNKAPSFYLGFSDKTLKIIDFTPVTDLKGNAIDETETPGVSAEKGLNGSKRNFNSMEELTKDVDVPGYGVITGNALNGYLNNMKDEFKALMESGNTKEIENFNRNKRLAPGLKYYKNTYGYYNTASPSVGTAFYADDNGVNLGRPGIVTARDNTAAPVFAGVEVKLNIPAKIILALEETQDRLESMIENEILERHYKKYKANVRCIGHPRMEGRQMIHIGQVARRHSGKYFVEKCVHHLSKDGGYINTLELIQNPRPITIVKGEKNAAFEAFKKAVAEDDGSAPVLLDDVSEITTKSLISEIQGKKLETDNENDSALTATFKSFGFDVEETPEDWPERNNIDELGSDADVPDKGEKSLANRKNPINDQETSSEY